MANLVEWFQDAAADQWEYFLSLEMTVRVEHLRESDFYQGRIPTPLVLLDDLLANEENQ